MTREPQDTRAWLGLDADADEADVAHTRARLEEYLAQAPPELAGWARRQLEGPAVTGTTLAAAGTTRGTRTSGATGVQTPRRRRSPLVPVGILAAAVTVGVLVYNMPDNGGPAAAGQNPSAAASAPADAMHGAPAAETPPPLDQAKVDDLTAKIKTNPKDVESMRLLANEYSRTAHYEKASETQAKIVALQPENVDARLALGVAHFNRGDAAGAEKEWQNVLQQAPESAEAHYDLGFLYFTQDPPRIDKAEEHWKKVVEIDPESDLAKTVSSHLDSFKKAAGDSTSPTSVPTSVPSAATSSAAPKG